MKKLITLMLIVLLATLNANESNSTKDSNVTLKQDSNLTEEELAKKQVEEQIKLEEKYAKEQKFYKGDNYDLKSKEINKKSLETLPVIEPDYDFDITDVYRDDI
jgi:uncharacterized membrane protein YgaE (UPF0421/DUF939 family)